MKQAEMGCRYGELRRIGYKRVGQGEEVVGQGPAPIGTAISWAPKQWPSMGAGNVMEQATVVTHAVEGNQDGNMITQLQVIKFSISILKVFVVMPGNARVGFAGLALEKVRAPESKTNPKEAPHLLDDLPIPDHLKCQHGGDMKIHFVLLDGNLLDERIHTFAAFG
jgi:hypothetical protein